MIIKCKFSRSVLVKLEEMKPEAEEWTVEIFRRLLKRHINDQKAGDLQTKFFQKPDESSRPPISDKLYPYNTNTQHSTGESLLSNKHQKSRFGRNCIFCNDEQYWSDEYSRYPDIQSLRKRLKNRCLKCLKRDHMMKGCRVTGKVAYIVAKRTSITALFVLRNSRTKKKPQIITLSWQTTFYPKKPFKMKKQRYWRLASVLLCRPHWLKQRQQIKCYLKLQKC